MYIQLHTISFVNKFTTFHCDREHQLFSERQAEFHMFISELIHFLLVEDSKIRICFILIFLRGFVNICLYQYLLQNS